MPLVWQLLETPTVMGKPEVGPVAGETAIDVAGAAGSRSQMEALRAQCVAMRDFVRIRRHTARQFAAPPMEGLAATSHPPTNWKLRAFAAHRRDFDREALRMEMDPAPVTPYSSHAIRGSGKRRPTGAAALALKERAGDVDLIIPTGQRERYEALHNVFPDAFYILS